MSDQLFEHAVRDWLDDGSDRTPPTAIEAVLLAAKTTPQERGLRIPRRFTLMPSLMRLTAAMAIVAIVGLAGLTYRHWASVGVPGLPSQTPAAVASVPPVTTAPSPTTNPLVDTDLWQTYISREYGFGVGHPDDWTVDAADRAWDLDTDARDWLSPATHDFTAPTGDVRVSVWAVPFNTTDISSEDELRAEVEAWIEQYCERTDSPSCAGILDGSIRLCVEIRDCHPGVLLGSPDREVQAFFAGGSGVEGSGDYFEKLVVVTLWRTDSDPSVARYGGGQALVEAFLSTMCVVREDPRPTTFPCG